jgi:cytochrome c oxidase assembly factor CtaG
MMGAVQQAVARAFRRTALPLGWYYAVTIALPLANGAAGAGTDFVDHALVVAVVPPLLIVIGCTVRETARLLATPWRTALRHERVPERSGSQPWKVAS